MRSLHLGADGMGPGARPQVPSLMSTAGSV